MNQDSWNELPDDIKQVFEEQSGEAWWREVGEIWTRTEVGGLKVATDAGNEHIVLTEAEIAAFREKLEPVVERWIAEVEKKGIDGRALVEAARAAIARHTPN